MIQTKAIAREPEIVWDLNISKDGKSYQEVGSLLFDPDSRHFVFLAQDKKKAFIVVDGVEGNRYDSILKPPTPKGKASRNVVFDSAESFHYLAVKGKKILLVEEKILVE